MGTDPHEISLEDYYVRPADGQRVTPERGAPGGADMPEAGPPRSSIESRAESRAAVALDTHAGDLMEVDGAPADATARWTGESESAHHRTGTLHISLDISPTRDVTLVFHDVGVEERTLSFDVSGAQRR